MLAAQTSIPRLEVIYNRVKADSQFSLDHLRAVDTVIDVTVDARNNAETIEKVCNKILNAITETGGFDRPIDPTGKLAPQSLSAEAVLKKTILALQEIDWPTLPAEHAEAVSESNEEAIVALQKLHDSLVDLRWAVLEHDADLEEPESEAFDNVKDLVADLRSR